MTDKPCDIEPGSGDMFVDLGFSPAEAAELQARSACMRRIKRIREQRRWTQQQLGDAVGMAQSEVSLLLNGKLSRFSLDRLLSALQALGVGVRITLFDDETAPLTVDDQVTDALL